MKNKLILLHGALGSMEQFDQLKEILSESFEVFAFNFEGHGGLPVPAEFSIELFVQHTIDYMDLHQLVKAHLFGYSMGGYVALKLAHNHPDRVDKIITLGTKYHWDQESAAKEVRMMNPEVIEQKIPSFADTLARRHMPADWKSIMLRTGQMMTELGGGKAMTLSDFGHIPHPVLVCIGSEDHMVTRHESEEVAAQLPHGHIRIVEATKHPLESVDPHQISTILEKFILV